LTRCKAGSRHTLPKTVCLLSNQGVGTVVMKNWLPLVLGPALAILRVKGRSCRKLRSNSSWNSVPQMEVPPVPSPAHNPACSVNLLYGPQLYCLAAMQLDQHACLDCRLSCLATAHMQTFMLSSPTHVFHISNATLTDSIRACMPHAETLRMHSTNASAM